MYTEEETLGARDFARLTALIYAEAGIRLGPEKKTMLEGRLRRRLRALDIGSCSSYCDYLFDGKGLREEKVHLIDAVTTNKTDFFREPGHFNYLVQTALPELAGRGSGGRPLLVWSAGCSSGEEPYTLAMVLSEYAAGHPGFRFRILATDISTVILGRARQAVYTADDAEPIPPALRKKYLLRSRDPGSARVRIVPELRELVEFRRLNFMETDYGVEMKADAIFCRNVLIYFDRATQEQIVGRLARCLVPEGYFFVGHSETLHEMKLPLKPMGPALYRRTDGRE